MSSNAGPSNEEPKVCGDNELKKTSLYINAPQLHTNTFITKPNLLCQVTGGPVTWLSKYPPKNGYINFLKKSLKNLLQLFKGFFSVGHKKR